MTIEGSKDGPESATQFGQTIIEYVQRAEFGSARHLAISDYFELQTLNDALGIAHKNLLKSQDRPGWESRVRITETQIALREHEITQRKHTIKGYAASYLDIYSFFEQLAKVAWDEAESKFPDDKEAHTKYYDRANTVIEDNALDALLRKFREE